jgi:hypothetical protein
MKAYKDIGFDSTLRSYQYQTKIKNNPIFAPSPLERAGVRINKKTVL